MNRKALIGLISGAIACLTLASVSLPAGAQSTDPGTEAPNRADMTAAQAGTAFTFQGQLKKDGGAFNGTCNFRFTLFDAAAAGAQVGAPQTVNATVTNGLFIAPLDFGNQFTGQARWLETAVKCAGDGDFIPQSPRLNMTSSPYAIGLIPGASINGAQGLTVNTQNGNALVGRSDSQVGVWGESATGAGVVGVSKAAWIGVYGKSSTGTGVSGESDKGAGVTGVSKGAWIGVYGESAQFEGVRGVSHNKDHGGVVGVNDGGGIAVYGVSTGGDPATRFAGYFDGKVGIAGGTDMAERFSSASQQPIEPGTVVVVDQAHPGQISPSNAAYASAVVGIVSGAGGVEPGLILHQNGMMEGPHVVAIAGRVYVKATASNGTIKPGDLLTTSDLPGYAMKATDRDRAYGAILGKALTGLDSGDGLVLVIVNLQ